MRYILSNLILIVLLTNCTTENSNKLQIATASNMQFVSQKLCEAFTQETDIECELIVSSSGKLCAQIISGAPFDVFISADMKYPEILYNENKTLDKPKIYTKGKLVLWSLKDSLFNSLDILESNAVKHICIANPVTAPYGIAAAETIKNKFGNSINQKIVKGESISQTNQFILSKAADFGFTSLFIVNSDFLKNKGKWIMVEESLYQPIQQGIVTIKGNNIALAQQFEQFILSKKGQKIIDKLNK
ncbi:molybdate ABC transporter substrate-binding protein [Flammeovirga kamogawensis]|uniref:Molybdate ABC transporter substrate-binding protein n=1 Tax=Flammeovirga kamogawensis TaxID=373891 RepID=A0ABX8GY81_9BACT|nr:molybdate ABC transporter substrate-binding protein [Flammeovirga kamogawensis]MBB6460912.1 molybdate transport system substrate-binding protein [Flammeovirga kamogawensis]QWG08256.1 molybdate ABC transporter substrate-binding protein [Flammeovirga kamogawensis]TRX70060.1 molybdate ABC transporter substrate-binding protein [Flammeovirga kamogawensis]